MSYRYLRNPDAYTIRKEYHTKREKDYYLVVPTERLGDEFQDFKASARAAGGWHNRKWGRVPGGFAFNTRQEAADWAAEAFGESGAGDDLEAVESTREAPPAVRPLYGHATEATAYKQTVGGKTRAYWLEYKKGKGYRFVSRTVAPRLTKPVKTTYAHAPAGSLYLDENSDVRWSAPRYNRWQGHLRFLTNFPGIDQEQVKRTYEIAVDMAATYARDGAAENPYFEPEYYQENAEKWGEVAAKAKSMLATAPAAPEPEKKPEKATDTAKMTAEEYTAAISKAIKQRKKILGVKSVSQGYKGTGSRAADRLIAFRSLDGKMVQLSLTGGGWGFTNVYRTDLSNVSQRRGTFTRDLKTDANQIRKALAQWTGVLPLADLAARIQQKYGEKAPSAPVVQIGPKPWDLHDDEGVSAGDTVRVGQVKASWADDPSRTQGQAAPGTEFTIDRSNGYVLEGYTADKKSVAVDARIMDVFVISRREAPPTAAPTPVVGFKWPTKGGNAEIVRVADDGTGRIIVRYPHTSGPGGEIIQASELSERIAWDAKLAGSAKRQEEKAKRQEEKAVSDQEVVQVAETKLRDYLSNFENPKRGRIAYALRKKASVQGELAPRYQHMERLVSEGYTKVGTVGGKPTLENVNGSGFFFFSDLTKTGVDYAQWLASAGGPDLLRAGPGAAEDVKAPVVPSPTPAPPADTTRTTQVVLGVEVRKTLPHFEVYATLTPTTTGGSASIKMARFSYRDKAEANATEAAAERYAKDLENRQMIALLDGAPAQLGGWISTFCNAGSKILVGSDKGSVLACSEATIETIKGWAQYAVEYIDKQGVTRSFGRSVLSDVYELGGDTASLLAGELAVKAEDTVNGLLKRYRNAARGGKPGDPSSLDAALSLDKKIRDLILMIRSATPPSKTEARKIIDTQKDERIDISNLLSELASQAGFLAVHEPRRPIKGRSMTTQIGGAVRFRERHPVGLIADEYDTLLNLFEDLYTSKDVKGKSGRESIVELSLTTQKGRRDEMIELPLRQYFIAKRTSSAPGTQLAAKNKIRLKAVDADPTGPSDIILVWEGDSQSKSSGTLSAQIQGESFSQIVLNSLRLLPEQGKAPAPAPPYPFEVGDLIETKDKNRIRGANQIFRVTENDALGSGVRYFRAGPVYPTLFPAIWEGIPPWGSFRVDEEGGLSGDWDDYKLWTASERQKNVTKASKVLRELREAGVESITEKALERDYGVPSRGIINALTPLYSTAYEERNGSPVWTIFTTPKQEALRKIWSEHPYLEASVAVQRVTEDMVSRIKPGTPVAFAPVGNQGEDTKTEFFPEDFRYAVVESADRGNIQLEPIMLARATVVRDGVKEATTAQYLPKSTGYRKSGTAKKQDEKGLHLYVQTSTLQAPKAPTPAPVKRARSKSKPVQAAEALGRSIVWYVTEHQPKWAPRGVLIIGAFKRAWQKFKKPGGWMGDPKPLDGVSQADFDAIKAMKDTSYGPGISGSYPGVKIPVKLRNEMIEALRAQGLTVNVSLDDNGRYEAMEIINPYSPYALLEAVKVRLSEAPNADALLIQFDREKREYSAEAKRLLAPETSNPRYTRRW